MRDDVRKLMGTAGWPAEAYREIAVEQHQHEAEAQWSLLAAVNRRLAARAANNNGSPNGTGRGEDR